MIVVASEDGARSENRWARGEAPVGREHTAGGVRVGLAVMDRIVECLSGSFCDVLCIRAGGVGNCHNTHAGRSEFDCFGFALAVNVRVNLWEAGAVDVVLADTRVDGVTGASATSAFLARSVARFGCRGSGRAGLAAVVMGIARALVLLAALTVLTFAMLLGFAVITLFSAVLNMFTAFTLIRAVENTEVTARVVLAYKRFTQTVALEKTAVVKAVQNKPERNVVVFGLMSQHVIFQKVISTVLHEDGGDGFTRRALGKRRLI